MDVSRRELYRYLGFGSEKPDSRTKELAESCLKELESTASPRFFSRAFPLRFLSDGEMDFTCFTVKSQNLRKNLEGCEQVVLFAATLGLGPDQLIRRYSLTQMSRAAVMQAASAAMIEAWCNEENERLRREYAAGGYFLHPRFSPGYGDFSLEYQTVLLRVLEAEKTVGITLTDSLLMMPSKSVTAVIGVSRRPCGHVARGCEACAAQNCPYRRG